TQESNDIAILHTTVLILPMRNKKTKRRAIYGNISIPKLIELMMAHGSSAKTMEAKIFGGASMNIGGSQAMMIGEKNVLVAREVLKEFRIPIVAEDIGGQNGRKIQFNLERGKVLMKYATRSEF
ncbi:chemotaxis protein CheD, partial [Sulfuricurvum sp.]|uniref:chemotaxis protein CheD n=1 Tax=Sulfuricurvum sp. TaxID=2025608 RepID=UPI00261C0DA3